MCTGEKTCAKSVNFIFKAKESRRHGVVDLSRSWNLPGRFPSAMSPCVVEFVLSDSVSPSFKGDDLLLGVLTLSSVDKTFLGVMEE